MRSKIVDIESIARRMLCRYLCFEWDEKRRKRTDFVYTNADDMCHIHLLQTDNHCIDVRHRYEQLWIHRECICGERRSEKKKCVYSPVLYLRHPPAVTPRIHSPVYTLPTNVCVVWKRDSDRHVSRSRYTNSVSSKYASNWSIRILKMHWIENESRPTIDLTMRTIVVFVKRSVCVYWNEKWSMVHSLLDLIVAGWRCTKFDLSRIRVDRSNIVRTSTAARFLFVILLQIHRGESIRENDNIYANCDRNHRRFEYRYEIRDNASWRTQLTTAAC